MRSGSGQRPGDRHEKTRQKRAHHVGCRYQSSDFREAGTGEGERESSSPPTARARSAPADVGPAPRAAWQDSAVATSPCTRSHSHANVYDNNYNEHACRPIVNS